MTFLGLSIEPWHVGQTIFEIASKVIRGSNSDLEDTERRFVNLHLQVCERDLEGLARKVQTGENLGACILEAGVWKYCFCSGTTPMFILPYSYSTSPSYFLTLLWRSVCVSACISTAVPVDAWIGRTAPGAFNSRNPTFQAADVEAVPV
jgi:hypothetical protein